MGYVMNGRLLKEITAGAFPGAMPTLIGWARASSNVDSNAWSLLAVLFLCLFPHFLPITIMYQEDYAHATPVILLTRLEL